MTKSDKLWNKAFQLEAEAEALEKGNYGFEVSVKISALYQKAGQLREAATKAES
jgi:hypothetical protein